MQTTTWGCAAWANEIETQIADLRAALAANSIEDDRGELLDEIARLERLLD
jgi:hypothetical protein